MVSEGHDVESVEEFRRRARGWIRANLPETDSQEERDDEARWDRVREIQRLIYEGGFAGICVPRQFEGLGLTPDHQRAFNEEAEGFELPLALNVPTFTIIVPTLLEFGTEDQLRRFIPPVLRGEEIWVQFLSEPSGGSDMAAAMTRATRDGDVFLLNGSKIWSSNAYAADYALCLARTDWDVPKHRGLTVLIVKVHQPGITVDRIRGVAGGSADFCQEFFDDVPIPAEYVLGTVDDGWAVASRILFHERATVGDASPYVVGRAFTDAPSGRQLDLVELAKATGQETDDDVRQLVAEAHANTVIAGQLVARVTAGITSGALAAPAGSLLRLMAARNGVRRSDIAIDIAGRSAVAWTSERDPGGAYGRSFIGRQGGELAGGSTEMQRNLISERLLGMPREHAPDRELPFRDVRHNDLPAR
ncbi:MAG TPA: acyl-CoA dehydrogenase family protein [Acidimicrobiia bacterium]